jgi:hypothetical protein
MLVHRLRVGIEPTLLCRRPVDPPVVLAERPLLAVVAVDLRARRHDHALAEPVAVAEDGLCPLHVRHHRPHRLLDDEPDADSGGQVIDDVALVNELADDGRSQHRVHDEVELAPTLQVLDVLLRPGRQIVEGVDLAPLLEQELGEMRADEAGAARYQGLRGLSNPLIHA